MQTKEAIVANAQGIHCRPSALIVKAFLDYPGTIRLTHGSDTCDVSSVLQLLSLEMHQGSHVKVEVEGPDEAATLEQVVTLLQTHFDFPPA